LLLKQFARRYLHEGEHTKLERMWLAQIV